MKTKVQRKWQKRIAIILCFTLMLTSLCCGYIISANAYTNVTFYYKNAGGSWSNTTLNVSSGNYVSFDVTLTANVQARSMIKADNDWFGNASLALNSERNLAQITGYSGISDNNNNTFTPSQSGTYTYSIKFTNDGKYIKITQKSVEETTAATTAATNPSTDTWTIAGSSSSIFGNTWAPDKTENDMTWESGNKYIKVYTNVQDTNSFEFKICKDHAWSTAYPSNNFTVTKVNTTTTRTISATSGTSGNLYWKSGESLTFIFDSESKNISITSETQHYINFSASAGGTISPSGSQRVGVTTKTNVTATPNEGYEFSNWSTSGVTMTNDAANGDGRTAKVVSTSDGSVTANFVAKKTYAITTVSNNKKLGSVSVSPSSAYAGQTVTVTFTNLSGTITSSSAKDADDGTVSLSGSNTSTTRTFTMPAKAVTVTGNFTLYSGDADFYYNGYTLNSTTTIKRDYYAKRMSEAMVNGQKFAYYHVSGRTDTDQLFNISYGNLDYDGNNQKENGNTHVWWTRPDSWSDHSHWSSDGNQYVMFYSSDQQAIRDWTNMSGDGADGNNYRFIANIPDGARYVRFKDDSAKTGHQTKLIDLKWTTGSNSYYDNGFYLNSSSNDNGTYTDIGHYNMSGSTTIPNVHEYFNSDSGSKYASGTTGTVSSNNPYGQGVFDDHGAGYNDNNNSMGSHRYSKPNGLTTDNKTDYYVILFYKNKSYTYNDVTRTNTSAFDVFWSTELPGGIETVKIYAKDGTVRREDSITTTSGKLGDTVITNDATNYPGVSNIENSNGSGYAADCNYQTAKVEKGFKFKVTTTVESEFRSTHYVKAFMVNGKGAKFFTHSNDGVYTMEYTVPEDFEGKTLEITPVYFLKDESDTVTFKIEGFDPTIQTTGKWGTTLYAYPFYAETIGGHQSAFYGYPGQPVVEDNGKYYIQIPIHNSNPADTNSTVVRGITLSNGYLDDVHKVCESKYVVDHRQTYDYDDFYKIYNEKHPDNITFSFKYKGTDVNPSYPNNASRDQKIAAERSAGNNHRSTFKNSSIASSFEQLTNYHGQIVNIFGTVLDNVTDEKTLYVISDGYWYNNAGSFGTEWCVFTESSNTYTYLGEIVPSALALNSADSFDKAAYTQTADASHGKEMLSSYKTFYNTLKASYSDYQVKIIYEDNIKGGNYKRINATNNQPAEGEDTAYRLDGRWTYSNDDDIINANIQIRYLDLTHSDIKDSTAETFGGAATSSAEKPVGDTTGAVAYFTNSDLNQAGQSYQNKMATGNVIGNKNKEFTFTTAISTPKATNYVFQGWYLLKDGKYSPMSKGSSPMNSTETYVALYRESSDSTITVSHNLMSGSGDGLTEVKLEVTGSTTTSYNKVYDFSEEPITATIDTGSTVTVTLSSTSAGANTFNGWYNSDGTLLDNGGSDNGTVVNGAAKQITLTPSDLFTGTTPKIRSKEYLSDFNNVTRQFKAVFHYTNRAGQDKKYTVKTVLDTYFVAAHPTSYSLTDTISEGVTLKQWVKDSAPSMIDLYGKNIKWTMTDAAMTSGFSAAQNKIDIDSATEIKTWNIVVETHSDGNVNNASTKHIDTKSNIPDNTYAENSGVYYTPENNEKFSYWSVFPLDLKTGNPKNNNELLRIYNYEFKVMITGNYYVKAIYTPGTVTKASVQEAVYSREVYDLDETGDTKKDDLYSDFIYSYMSERNSVELKNNSDYLSGLAVEVSQGTKVPEGTSKAVDYSEYTFVSDNSNIESYVAAITASTANGAKIGSYTYTADGKSDKRSVYCYPILNSNYNNFNRGDFAIMYGSNQSWTKYIMKAYYYVKNTSTGTVQISEHVYFCLHNTKVTVFASSNTIVES